MKLLAVIAALCLSIPAQASQTWFVRADGGTRFSANVTAGQCDGLADVAYPGTGTNQHCAFNDYRYLYDDDSGVDYHTVVFWVIAGGDTVVVRGCHALTTQMNAANPTCRVGWDINTGGGSTNKWCTNEGSFTCFSPPIPAGTSGAHTRILGGCAYDGNCHPVSSYPYTSNNLAQIFGGFSLSYTFNLSATQYVDVAGIELTTHNYDNANNSQCIIGIGPPNYPIVCSGSSPLSDYAQNGFVTDNTTAHVTLTDVYIHGFNASAIRGPIGGAITTNRVIIAFNAFAGWNFADNSDTPNGTGSSLDIENTWFYANGFSEEYPIVHTTFPAKAGYDQSSNGFGDAISGQDTNIDSIKYRNVVTAYNTKDGFIGPHAAFASADIQTSIWYANGGQALKWGSQTNATLLFQNNLVMENCYRNQALITGAGQNFAQSTSLPGSYLGLPCRAGGSLLESLIQNGSIYNIQGNTFVFAGGDGGGLELDCGPAGGGGTNCAPPTTQINFTDNIFLAYTNPTVGDPGNLYDIIGGTGIVPTSNYNVYYGFDGITPDVCAVNHLICSNPLLTSQPATPWPGSEAALDNFNWTPTSGSPATHAGTTLSGMTTDYYGVTRPSPPSIGAVELGSAPTGHVSMSGIIRIPNAVFK